MARIHKVEMYLIDANDEYSNAESQLEHMIDRSEFSASFIKVKSSDHFDWDDDIAINQYKCTKKDYEKYFK